MAGGGWPWAAAAGPSWERGGPGSWPIKVGKNIKNVIFFLKKYVEITWSWLFFFLLQTANHAGHRRQMRMRIIMRMTRMPMGMVMARMVLVSIPVSEGWRIPIFIFWKLVVFLCIFLKQTRTFLKLVFGEVKVKVKVKVNPPYLALCRRCPQTPPPRPRRTSRGRRADPPPPLSRCHRRTAKKII